MNEWSEYISCTSIEIDDGAISYSHSGKYKGNLFNINQIKGGWRMNITASSLDRVDNHWNEIGMSSEKIENYALNHYFKAWPAGISFNAVLQKLDSENPDDFDLFSPNRIYDGMNREDLSYLVKDMAIRLKSLMR